MTQNQLGPGLSRAGKDTTAQLPEYDLMEERSPSRQHTCSHAGFYDRHRSRPTESIDDNEPNRPTDMWSDAAAKGPNSS